MKKARNFSLWTEKGYELLAIEGLDGIQVERLARMLQLNKSGFYHYFGDLQGFCDELMVLHLRNADLYMRDLKEINSIDPEFLNLLVKYKTPIMFQLQLIRSKNNEAFYKAAEKIDQREEIILRSLWTDYIGFHDNPDLAIRYYTIVRDMLYARLSFQNMNYPYLRSVMNEARELMQQIVRQSAVEIENR